MNTRAIIEKMSFILVFISLFCGCAQKEIPPPTPLQSENSRMFVLESLLEEFNDWNAFKRKIEGQNYRALNAKESMEWLKKWQQIRRIAHLNLSFRFPSTISVDGALITVDNMEKPRVFIPLVNGGPGAPPHGNGSGGSESRWTFVTRLSVGKKLPPFGDGDIAVLNSITYNKSVNTVNGIRRQEDKITFRKGGEIILKNGTRYTSDNCVIDRFTIVSGSISVYKQK